MVAQIQSDPSEMTAAPDRQALRAVTRTFYDYQRLRIMIGNRLAAQFRVRLGQEPGEPSTELSKEALDLIAQLKEEYTRLADALAHTPRKRYRDLIAGHRGIISSPEEYVLAGDYITAEGNETRMQAEVAALVEDFPIWRQFLKGVRGCGPLMSAVIISEFDPALAYNPSQFWKYAGLDVAEDGKGRSKRAEHLIKKEYTTHDGEIKEKDSVTFNPFLKTKLAGVLSTSFLRAQSPYRDLYDGYKHRMESHPRYGLAAQAAKSPEATPMHRHRMALRYMVKQFLVDLWRAWRQLEGLPVGRTYAEEKLGIVHGQTHVVD